MSMGYRRAVRSAALLAAALVAACGGGGSGSSTNTSTETVAITQANYLDFATDMGRSVAGMNGSSAAAGGVGGTSTGATAAGTRALAQQVRSAGHVTAMSVKARPEASSSFSDACAFGGTLSGTASYANASTVTAGDSVSMTFANCVEESGGVALNGTMAMSFNAYIASPLTLDVNGSFTNFSAGTAALNGGYRLTLSESNAVDTLAMSFSGMTIGSDPTTFDTTLSGSFASNGSATFSVGGSITTTGGRYTLTQVTPFAASGGDPVSGVLRLSDPQGNAVQMTANADGSVIFAYYPSGSTVATATSSSFTWAQFRQ